MNRLDHIFIGLCIFMIGFASMMVTPIFDFNVLLVSIGFVIAVLGLGIMLYNVWKLPIQSSERVTE